MKILILMILVSCTSGNDVLQNSAPSPAGPRTMENSSHTDADHYGPVSGTNRGNPLNSGSSEDCNQYPPTSQAHQDCLDRTQ